MLRTTFWLLALAALTLPAAAHAQTGKIAGRVVDTSGEPLVGVNVQIDGTQQGNVTDLDGYYTILNVRPGTYAVRASYVGFAGQTVEGVRVQIDKTAEVDFRLAEEAFEGEEVVVTAERPLVQRDLTSTSASVSREQLQSLPVQSFQDVVNLQAGVSEGHFRGGRIGEVAYLVDGIPVNDVFDGSAAYQVENDAIQEIEIISGTFNAEYGQAQSGVVSIVTRDGGSTFEGSLNAYAGGYATGESDLFEGANGLGAYEAQGTLSGPIWGERLTFFASGRLVRNDGWLYGRRVVLPVFTGLTDVTTIQVDGRNVRVPVNPDGSPALGDSALASMSWSEQATGQLKLTLRPWSGGRLTASGLVQRDEGQNYDHLFRYNPGGRPTVHGASESVTAAFNQVIGTQTVLDVRAAAFRNTVSEYLYENPLDERYPYDQALAVLGGNFAFFRGGASMRWFERSTDTYLARVDVSSQLTRLHLVKAGVEVKQHRLTLDEFGILRNSSTGFEPQLPQPGTPDRVRYDESPVEFAAYVQDKMEFDYLVVNAGLRLDAFNANSTIPADFEYPTGGETRETTTKWQVSPRVGVAFPLSESGSVHVAYGHFFQMPSFSYLFTNPDYRYNPEVGLGRAFGFADLEPEQTVAYELGLQQAFGQTIGVDLTVYYKDVRNLLGTRLETLGPDQNFALERYGRFVNTDYGNVKGLIVAFEKRASRAGGASVNLDYTFQIARGNASDPRDLLADEASGNEPEKQLAPLDWDRRHQLNARLAVGSPAAGAGLLSLIGRVASGLPYTPARAGQRLGVRNSARKPPLATADLFYTRQLRVAGLTPGLFVRVYNLFDARIVRDVYAETGRTSPNLRDYTGEPAGLNTLDEFITRPDFYAPPRQVQIGASLSF
jgi:outer membrane receptor protein involved in Fe transport